MRPPPSETKRLPSKPAGRTFAPSVLASARKRSKLRPKTPGEALEIAKRYWRTAPVDVYRLAAELGLGPVEDPGLPDDLSGLIEKIAPEEWQIVVNRNHEMTRRRFTIAHQLGHFIFHRARLEAADGASDTLAYQVDDQICPNPQIGWEEEQQASSFAINLLIPDHVLRKAKAIGITDDAELARGFNVSRTAMRVKLGLPMLRPVA
jgi:hypothetical protein